VLQHTSACISMRQHTSACVSIRQHTSAYVSMRHTSAYVSIRQHTSANCLQLRPPLAALAVALFCYYISIRQHTSAYVSIRQHTAYVSIRQPPLAALVVAHFVSLRAATGASSQLAARVSEETRRIWKKTSTQHARRDLEYVERVLECIKIDLEYAKGT
jgi:hypothetical protein